MDKKLFITIGVIILILAGILAAIYFTGGFKPKTVPNANGIILFYGDGCPHCALLDKWITDNGVEEKIDFAKLEVYNNQANQKLLVEKATACGIATDSIGVPFLWTGTECLVGDEPIEQFFQQMINLNTNITTNDANK